MARPRYAVVKKRGLESKKAQRIFVVSMFCRDLIRIRRQMGSWIRIRQAAKIVPQKMEKMK
jgi:hypothetical protein